MTDAIVEIAVRAGRLARRRAGRLDHAEVQRKSSVDLVTSVDRELEDLLRAELLALKPGAAFLGEEGDYAAAAPGAPIFVVDPLDGTTSFIHGHPFYSISIAYREGGLTRLGVVHLPEFGTTYWAEAGKGAFRDGRRLQVSPTERLLDSLVATGFACVRARLQPDGIPLFTDMVYRVRDVRRCGSAAIDLCYVAEGRYDLYWEMHLQPWDLAAGALLVTEAGGRVTDWRGGPDFESNRQLVASNGRIHPEFLAVARNHLNADTRQTAGPAGPTRSRGAADCRSAGVP